MDAVKHRRMLTQTDLLSILESDAAELALAESKLGEVAGQILDGLYEPGMFTRLVKSGALEASTVNVGEEPAFVMLYTRNLIGWLTVEGVAGLGRAPLARLFEAGDALARHYQCQVIQYVTRLGALFRFGCGAGFQPLGVIMARKLA